MQKSGKNIFIHRTSLAHTKCRMGFVLVLKPQYPNYVQKYSAKMMKRRKPTQTHIVLRNIQYVRTATHGLDMLRPLPYSPTKISPFEISMVSQYVCVCSGVPRNFVPGGGGVCVQQIQLRTQSRENGDLGAVLPSQGFRSICKWVKHVFLLGRYGCIFHGTGNSAQLCTLLCLCVCVCVCVCIQQVNLWTSWPICTTLGFNNDGWYP
jgi:hypothetical protein